MCVAGHASAQEASSTAPPVADVLPAVTVTDSGDYGFTAQQARSSTKSDKPLFETPQSVSVLTRELLDSRQVTTLSEALQTTAGVTSGGLGRRGWDDFAIRGQDASNSTYVDGLKLGQGNWFAQEVSGVERIEVVKGPDSINFGQMQPGGIVNMVSKRPRADAFNQVGFAVGSHDFRQMTFDFGRPLTGDGKAAFRINGLASDSDDPTDFVYFKNRYIAPSLSLDLGARTDFTILTSFSQREYIRQQGLPSVGSILLNPNGQLDRDLFVGDPSVGPYKSSQGAIGYALTHRFDSGWTLRQNFRWQDVNVDGPAVFVSGALISGDTVQKRIASFQDIQEHSAALDTNVERTYELGGMAHSVMVGLDLNRDTLRNNTDRCAIGSLNLYNPVYGMPVSGCKPNTATDTTVSYAALYLRDQIRVTDRLDVNLAVRHDRAKTDNIDDLKPANTQTINSHVTTGNVALMYKVTPNIAPYIGYATSFLPVTGVNADGQALKPEEGKQSEIGVKYQSDDKRINASLSYFDLKRRNVSQADSDNPGAQIQIGEECSKGYEAEVAADLRNGWSLTGALTVLDAEITDDIDPENVGERLQNVPGHSASVWANYRFRGALNRWGAGMGVRHESSKTSPGLNFSVPAYTVADASVSYQGTGYRLLLNVKNLFDKDYYAGVLSNGLIVPLGDPRTVMLKAVFDF